MTEDRAMKAAEKIRNDLGMSFVNTGAVQLPDEEYLARIIQEHYSGHEEMRRALVMCTREWGKRDAFLLMEETEALEAARSALAKTQTS